MTVVVITAVLDDQAATAWIAGTWNDCDTMPTPWQLARDLAAEGSYSDFTDPGDPCWESTVSVTVDGDPVTPLARERFA